MSAPNIPNPTTTSTSSTITPAPSTATSSTSTSASTSASTSPPPTKVRPPKPVYANHASFPRLTGTTEVLVPHLHKKGPPRAFHISNDDLQFELQPQYFGGADGYDTVLYLNAQNWEWYKQVLPNPRMHIWLLYDRIRWRDGYFKRRLVEEAVKRNIQITVRVPNRFDLCLPPTLDAPTTNHDTTVDPAHPHSTPFIPTQLPRNTTNAAGIRTISYQGVHVPLPHAVIPRLGATIDYPGRMCMRHLESLGVKVFNPISSVEISRDKFFTHQILAPYGVPIPKSILSRTPFDLSYIEREFAYPIIVKATSGSQGDAVWKVDQRSELLDLLKQFDLTTQPIILQTYLASTRGRDLRCFVVGDEVVAAMMRIAATGFKANVHQGGTVKPIQPSPELAQFAVDTSRLSLLDFSGVDILIDHDHYKICEINSSPGCEGLERATGCNATKAIIEYVAQTVDQMHNQTTTTSMQHTS